MFIVKNDLPRKRALILFGSPHKNGNTARLLSTFCEACPLSVDWETWDCFAHPVHACDDCRYCYRHNGCAKSDLDELCRKLEEADILVVATPVYNLSYSAPLKTVIDRTQRYWAARFIRGEKPPIAHPKRAVLLTTAETDREGGKMVEFQLKPTLTVLNARLTASVHAVAGEGMEEGLQQAKEAAAVLNCKK